MANHPLEGLLAFSLANHLIERQDLPFCRNLLLDVMGLEAPSEPYRPYETEHMPLPETATPFLQALTCDAVSRGVCQDTQGERDAFAARLEEVCGLKPVLWDERRTTVEAHSILHASGKRMKQHKKTVDAVAATLILEGYLTFRRRSGCE